MLESKPTLVQISSAWNSREGAPLGRNQYVELEIKKAKANGAASKLPTAQKPCDKMSEAIVMDGGKRGQTVKVCADPNCRVHHANTPSPQQVAKERAEERRRIEKEKLATHRDLFVLKGALLLQVWTGETYRPTRDRRSVSEIRDWRGVREVGG